MLNQFLHWLKGRQSRILVGLLVILFVDVMIDPNDLIFHLKYVLFIIVLVVWILERGAKKSVYPRRLLLVVVFISGFMPFYALSVGVLSGAFHNVAVGTLVYFNSFFFFLMILVTIHREPTDLTRIFNNAALLVAFITVGFYLILLLDTSLFGNLYKYFVLDKRVAMYAIRSYGKITALMIYYKTSPVLVFPLSYYLYQMFINTKKKSPLSHYLLVFLIAATLVLSGTRANLFSLAFILLFYIGFYIYRKSRLWFVLVASFFLLAFLFIFPTLFHLFLNPHIASNVVKFGYISSYADFFSQNPLSLIFGQGIGGEFFASGLNRFMGVTELTYLELVRIWGIPATAIFGIILIWPLVMEIKSKKLSHLFIAYLAFLFIAGTNPLLLSSTGMLVLVYVFSVAFGPDATLRPSINRPEN